ncbi:YbjN domain-containing protein [Hyphococcus luteus]|nr:YbjN domain-containing protein [Marinicaulis flavus]
MKPITAFFGAAAMALAAGVSGASAQNSMGSGESSGMGLSNPETVVRKFSVQSVGPVLNELGMPWQVGQLSNGAQYMHAAAGGMQFVLFFTACTGTECAGMQSLMMFGETGANSQTVQAFNARYPFATAGIDQEGSAYISRYDIADYGIPRGNIASSLVNFLLLSEMFAKELANSHQTVSLEGYAGDLSSSHLNRQELNHVAGAETGYSNQSDQHADGFEQGAELIRLFLEDDAAPRNKISNVKD